MMKNILAATLAALTVLAASAQAAVIDPNAGLSGSLTADPSTPGVGLFLPVDTVAGMPGNTATITVAADSLIDFIIADDGVPGDAFALQLNGVTLAYQGGNLGPSTRGPGATDLFSAFITSILLPAGVNVFSFFYTDACCDAFTLNNFQFSAVRPVPVPGALPLFLTAVAAMGLRRRRRSA